REPGEESSSQTPFPEIGQHPGLRYLRDEGQDGKVAGPDPGACLSSWCRVSWGGKQSDMVPPFQRVVPLNVRATAAVTGDVSGKRKLWGLWEEVDFDRRYYAYYESHPNPEATDSVVSDKDLATALSQTALDFEYIASEHLFRHKEVCDSIELMFGGALLGG